MFGITMLESGGEFVSPGPNSFDFSEVPLFHLGGLAVTKPMVQLVLGALVVFALMALVAVLAVLWIVAVTNARAVLNVREGLSLEQAVEAPLRGLARAEREHGIIGRVIVSILFIPAYFKGELLTVYQLLGDVPGACVPRRLHLVEHVPQPRPCRAARGRDR